MSEPGLKIVLHDYSGHPFQVELARELARRGHRVHHCFSDSMQTPQGALARRDDDPATFTIAPVRLGHALAKYSYLARWKQERRYAELLAQRIAEQKPDLVICGNSAPDIRMAALQAARVAKAGLVFWLQHIYGEATKRILPRRLPVIDHVVAYLLVTKETRCLRQSNAIVSISDDFLPLLKSMQVPADRCITIEN